MDTTAQLIRVFVVMIFAMLAFPLYIAVVQHGATCLSGVGLALHLVIIGFVLSVVTLLVVMRRGMRNT